MCDETDNRSLSMVDVLEIENNLADDANAVLGSGFDSSCSYHKGYVQRQPLYSCVTCRNETTSMERAVVCLGCSLSCHDGHELIELYTKRNTRCDCGNSKFPSSFSCTFVQTKDPTNRENTYNQNFDGLYCTCHRPYPDPDNSCDDEMIQCVVCEDWYHASHLGRCTPPESEDYSEMICQLCMVKHMFLWLYNKSFQVTEKVNEDNAVEDHAEHVHVDSATTKPDLIDSEDAPEGSETVEDCSTKTHSESVTTKSEIEVSELTSQNVESGDDAAKASLGKRSTVVESPSDSKRIRLVRNEDKNPSTTDIITTENTNDDPLSSTESISTSSCFLKQLESVYPDFKTNDNAAAFWPADWRKKLCTCTVCIVMYEEQNLMFLLDETDTVEAYESSSRVNRSCNSNSSANDQLYEQSVEALGSMNRLQQVEMISGYNEMKTELTDFLKGFAENKQTVTEDDIKGFFAKLESRRKLRAGNLGIQDSCR